MEPILSFNLTDLGNAKALVQFSGNRIRHCPVTNRWLMWNGDVWKAESDGPLYEMMIDMIRRRRLTLVGLEDEAKKEITRHLKNSENYRKLRDAITVASKLSEVSKSSLEFDQDTYKLGVKGGEIDLKELEWSEPQAGSYLTMQAGVKFELGAQAPKWEKFLEDIFNNDSDTIRWVQKAIGYCLTGDVGEQVLFVCVGEGSNGKSTFLEVLKTMLGDYAATASFSTFDSKSRNDQTNDLARLRGKRLVTIIESEEDAYLAESKVKMVTGDEPISCRFLFREFFEYIPQFKVWMAVNREPKIRGMDYGIRRRVMVVRFDRRFEGSERVNNLKEQLLAELPGILNWALTGLQLWREEGLQQDIPETVVKANQQYNEEMDVIGQWFSECVEVAEDGENMRAKDLYASYRGWMQEAGLRPKGITEWGKDMKLRRLADKKRDKHGEKYLKVRLVESWDWVGQAESRPKLTLPRVTIGAGGPGGALEEDLEGGNSNGRY